MDQKNTVTMKTNAELPVLNTDILPSKTTDGAHAIMISSMPKNTEEKVVEEEVDHGVTTSIQTLLPKSQLLLPLL